MLPCAIEDGGGAGGGGNRKCGFGVQPDCGGKRGGRGEEGAAEVSVLVKTLDLMKACEKSVLMHAEAMLSMLDFLQSVLCFLVEHSDEVCVVVSVLV